MKVLVLGGTRYFGKRLVELLLSGGHAVTVATRGIASDSFGNAIERRVVDRSNQASLTALAATGAWDIVVDQICYSPNEAMLSCEVFKGRIGRYVHTSTASVYLTHGDRPESDFDPFHYPLRMGDKSDFDYGEGKRLAEAVFFQRASFPVAAMRIPIVLGPDDYTGRLEFHIDHVREGRPIVIPNLDAETSFISSSEAARFLLWLIEGSSIGPLNACSQGRISIREILEIIATSLGKKAETSPTGPVTDATPFVNEKSRCLDTRKARSLGFQFEPLRSWFPALVDEICRNPSSKVSL